MSLRSIASYAGNLAWDMIGLPRREPVKKLRAHPVNFDMPRDQLNVKWSLLKITQSRMDNTALAHDIRTGEEGIKLDEQHALPGLKFRPASYVRAILLSNDDGTTEARHIVRG